MSDESPFNRQLLFAKGILNDRHEVVPAKDIYEWSRWFEEETEKRIVGSTNINGFFVSTVFLAIDHSFGKGAKPRWFETMIFKDETAEAPAEVKSLIDKVAKDQMQWRYETWAEAAEGHETVVEMIRRGLL